ncbi:MAG TPA: DUF4159 domain-containing protein [bacterium]|nr:DUF4159 domain-containing protein [bacterium]HPP87304.1 DUF4159 domain-containing protein [bacterium]
MKKIKFLFFCFFLLVGFNQNIFGVNIYSIGRLKYSGGGDWYADPTSLPNVHKYLNNKFKFLTEEPQIIEPTKKDLFKAPLIFITGHGNIKLSEKEIRDIRDYLKSGGFLYIDDCYGLDKSVRELLKKILPESELVELPQTHKIYSSYYKLNSTPKIHEHDNLPAQGLGMHYNNRLVVFYTYQSDIGDGVEDEWVHNLPHNLRDAAMKMFVNIVMYNLLYNY